MGKGGNHKKWWEKKGEKSGEKAILNGEKGATTGFVGKIGGGGKAEGKKKTV